jgi:dinuclear metal center YbgI/SA1388 family protein
MPTVADLTQYLDRFAPPALAAEWDNVGLLLGDPRTQVDRILACLTLTADVVEEAVAERVNLIVSHHPILFRGAKQLVATRGDGMIVWPLARAGIAVYSPHTAFDNCPGGINDILIRRLGVAKAEPLRTRDAAKQFKLVVFVPDSDLAKVSDAVFAAGAGVIGQYEQCSYRLAGKGTFFGTDSTNPTIGEKGRREEVDEWRLEVVVPEAKLTTVVRAMRASHSYEEPAFDIYPLHPSKSGGEGRIGELPEATTLGRLAKTAKAALNAGFLQTVGDAAMPVRRIAVACGAAGEFLSDAIRAGADVFVTGELRFHDALAARAAGIGVLVPGHYATERPGIEELAAKLAADWPGVTVWPSRVERDPLADFR